RDPRVIEEGVRDLAVGERSDGELRVRGRADLPHRADVERSREGLRDLVSDDDAAARQREDDRQSERTEAEPLRESSAGLGSITECGFHPRSSPLSQTPPTTSRSARRAAAFDGRGDEERCSQMTLIVSATSAGLICVWPNFA